MVTALRPTRGGFLRPFGCALEQLFLYPERGLDYFREKRRARKYVRKAPTKRHDKQ